MSELELIRLPNGVRVALDPMPGLATAAVNVSQRVGARWEGPKENGVAHLFEHMAFKGAGGRDARQFAEAVEAVGGMLNASTSYETTAYYARVTAEHVPFALDLIADIVFLPHWAPEDLEKEKLVVAQERAEAADAPDDHVFELHHGALYAGQALGRPILGDEKSVRGLSVASLQAFRDAHLSPERLVVSLAGAFDRPAVLEALQRRYGELAPGAEAACPPARPQAGVAQQARKVEQTHLVLSWPAPAMGSDLRPAARLLAEIFGGGMSSRLFQEVREARGLAYSISAYVDSIEDDGRLGVYAACGAANVGEVSDIVRAELEALAEAGPTPSELQRAKAVSRAQMLMGVESPAVRANSCAVQLFVRDRLIPLREFCDRIDAVELEGVQAMARAALAGPVCAAAVGPKAGHGALAAFRAR